MSWTKRMGVALGTVAGLVAWSLPGRAQDTPAGPGATPAQVEAKAKGGEAEAGTSEATEALQKATQNPVASLISVPVQNNSNFGVNPGYRTQDVFEHSAGDTDRDFEGLEFAGAVDHAGCVSTDTQRAGSSGNWRVRIGRHAADIFLFTEESGKTDLGSWAGVSVADGNKSVSGTGQVGAGPVVCRVDAAGPLDTGRAGEQCVVGGGFGYASGCESVSGAVFY
jgi:hypothetical protein